MKEIDFRAWDTKENKMIDCFSNLAGWVARDSLENAWRLKRFIKLQYVGLESQDGNQIYEGDIVDYVSPIDGKRYIATIPSLFEFHWFAELSGNEDFIIIGNKFENPELLESGYERNN